MEFIYYINATVLDCHSLPVGNELEASAQFLEEPSSYSSLLLAASEGKKGSLRDSGVSSNLQRISPDDGTVLLPGSIRKIVNQPIHPTGITTIGSKGGTFPWPLHSVQITKKGGFVKTAF